MSTAVFIPARWESTRFPGKPLVSIDGRSLIEWTWRAALQAGYETAVLTDDARIAKACARFGADVIETSADCLNGTERCAEAAAKRPDLDIVVNWQGDAPLMPAGWARRCAEVLESNSYYDVATPGYLAPTHPGSVRAIVIKDEAVEFCRSVAPWGRYVINHAGLYAYRASVLRHYGITSTYSERSESLEQNRWLDMRVRIALAQFPAPEYDLREVNYPADVAAVADVLRSLHVSDRPQRRRA